jgi:3-hydroxyisobutyrate dehydrogenase-like beta-hydroxyacid dehydrogenase
MAGARNQGAVLATMVPMGTVTVGLLHPGEMGAAVGQCLVAAGHRVLWVPEGRSPASAARAAAAGLTAASLESLVLRADVIVSVVPPHAALDVAREVAGFGGLYVDANAVSPATMREIASVVVAGGASCVDGGIIGTPPVAPGFIRLYLSGDRAREVQRLFAGGPVDARVIGDAAVGGAAGPAVGGGVGSAVGGGVGGGVGAASAVKMAYASWTKGSAALLLAARALARAGGVEEDLLAEWGISQSQPGLAERSDRAAGSAAAKGWRWVAEMEEIAASMAAAGLPDGFHRAAAEIYRRAGDDGSLDAVLTALLGVG